VEGEDPPSFFAGWGMRKGIRERDGVADLNVLNRLVEEREPPLLPEREWRVSLPQLERLDVTPFNEKGKEVLHRYRAKP